MKVFFNSGVKSPFSFQIGQYEKRSKLNINCVFTIKYLNKEVYSLKHL